jgi:hypothetical protein
LYWGVDVLFPPVFNCYGVHLGRENVFQSALSRRSPITIADVQRRRCRCWTPNLLIATISVLPSQPLRICSATAM